MQKDRYFQRILILEQRSGVPRRTSGICNCLQSRVDILTSRVWFSGTNLPRGVTWSPDGKRITYSVYTLGDVLGTIKSFDVASKQAESLISPGMVIFCILNKKIKATGWVPRSLSGWIGAADYCTVTVTLNG